MSASTSVGSPATSVVKTADLSQFQAGNIISDAAFFNSGSMSEAQIQSFLQSKVPTCQSGYVCLKDWYDTSRSTPADAMCGAYSGGVRERASTIIFKVAQACGINPQVLLVMLQKEQGLVTHTWPSDWRYTIAMGQGCPDTAACDTRYYGFFNQVYGSAWQLKRYSNPAGTSQYFTWYAPGKTWNVRWHPNEACGSAPVYIQNQATANLYYYTPYQPNAASIRAGYGEGDGCSSYGNRNFYQYFTDWFGETQAPPPPAAPTPNPIPIPADAPVPTPAPAPVNVAGSASVVASSQNTSTGQTALKAVDGEADGYPGDSSREWATVGGTDGSTLTLTWSAAQTISSVRLYDRPNDSDQVTGGTLTFSDGSVVQVPELENDGTATTVTFTARSTTSIRFTVTSVSDSTDNVGLAEIETFQ